MQGFRRAMLCLFLVSALSIPGSALTFPQLLPDADSFKLTIREDPNSSLPLGAACKGEASLTLACRAFTFTLKNIGTHTVHLSRIACQEPVINFDQKMPPNTGSLWMPVGVQSRPGCEPWKYENLRLSPGETTSFRTRLISQERPEDVLIPVTPGSFTIRARWLLWGCTENPEGSDCLAPLQVMKPNSWGGPPTGEVEIQEPVEVTSNEIEVNSPVLPDLGPLQIGFEISLAPEPQASETRKRFGNLCANDPGTSIECTVFHYAIRNLGSRPIRNGRFTCSDFSILPEFRLEGGNWKGLESRLRQCTRNFIVETPILSGKTVEVDFLLGGLAPRFDTSPLYPAGRYEFRFRFQPSACFASSDASFCIQTPKEQATVTSNVIVVNATTFNGGKPSSEKH